MKQLNATQCTRFIQKHVPKNKRSIVLSTLVNHELLVQVGSRYSGSVPENKAIEIIKELGGNYSA